MPPLKLSPISHWDPLMSNHPTRRVHYLTLCLTEFVSWIHMVKWTDDQYEMGVSSVSSASISKPHQRSSLTWLVQSLFCIHGHFVWVRTSKLTFRAPWRWHTKLRLPSVHKISVALNRLERASSVTLVALIFVEFTGRRLWFADMNTFSHIHSVPYSQPAWKFS